MKSSQTSWTVKPLHEVVALQRGFDLPHAARRPGPFKVLTSGKSDGYHDQGPIKGPGITIGRATNLGRPKWSEGDFWPHNTTMFVRDFKKNSPRWVFHMFEALDLSGYDSGSVQPMLNRNYIAQVSINVPPLFEQRAIAEVLGALDDKIAANARLAAAVEALSYARFSALLDESSLRPLSSVADFINGKAFTKNATGTGRVVIRIAELNSGMGRSTVYNDLNVDEMHLARPGDILFAWSGSLTLHRWFRSEAIINQHIFKVVPHPRTPRWLVWHLIDRKMQEFRNIAADKATTMGHIQRRHLDTPALVPSSNVVSGASVEMEALWNRSLLAEQENLSFIETRDALLPALMSGRLRVEEAERVVEGLV